jgi:hypothetical protein
MNTLKTEQTPPALGVATGSKGRASDADIEVARQCVRNTLEHEEASWGMNADLIAYHVGQEKLKLVRQLREMQSRPPNTTHEPTAPETTPKPDAP